MAQYFQDFLTVIGALGALATALSHFPGIPAKTQAFFSRFGMTTAAFTVKKDITIPSPSVSP